jgi:hypothetical protein
MRAFDAHAAPRDALRERGFVLGIDARLQGERRPLTIGSKSS